MSDAVTEFNAPERSFAGLDARSAASLIATTTDVALVLDTKGIIRDIAVGNDDLPLENHRKWIGRPWAETVTVESRPKVAELLREAASRDASRERRRWRNINHPAARGAADVPILYAAFGLGKDGAIAVGRDMRSVSALQQRLVAAQQSMERDYLRLRQLETRYRLLFQVGAEPIVIVDAATQCIVEANPAAARLLGDPVKRLVGRVFADCFDARGRRAVSALLGRTPAAGRSEDVDARLDGTRQDVRLSTSVFKQDDGVLFLVRIAADPDARAPASAGASAAPLTGASNQLARVLDSVPDGFVVTDWDGRILSANAAFLDMAQLTAPEQARGESLEHWLGRSGVDLNVLLAHLREQGAVRLFATTLHGQYGSSVPVEISAAAVPDEQHPVMGFTVRDVGRRLGGAGGEELQELPRSVSHLAKLVGRVPLKDIVGETTDLIEKMCIEAALELTRDNRASAAEMLGLSRQSLYVKLRRYGLGDLGGEG